MRTMSLSTSDQFDYGEYTHEVRAESVVLTP